ncbi:MAG: DMT family transporter [Flavobacteriales bacterium]
MKARPVHFLLLIVLALTWGSSFILMKKGMRDTEGLPVFTAFQVAAMRLSMAGLILLPVSIHAFRKLKLSDYKWIAVVGLVGSGIPAFLFTTAQSHLDSGISGILNSLTPLFTLIVGLVIFRRKTNLSQVAGVTVGLLGAIFLILLGKSEGQTDWAYALLIVIATFSYGLSVNTVPSKLAHVHSLHITSVSLLMAGIPCAVYVWLSDVQSVVINNPAGWSSFGYVLILACLGTAVANVLYFQLTQETSALFASSVTYLMPLVAILWGVYDNEVVTWEHMVCAAIIIGGVWLVNRGRIQLAAKK